VRVEDCGTRSVPRADSGAAVLDLVLLDGRGVTGEEYSAGDFVL
jgi:hypothetical protein